MKIISILRRHYDWTKSKIPLSLIKKQRIVEFTVYLRKLNAMTRAAIMQKNSDIISGLGSPIFQDTEAKFQREQNFGRKLFIAAWAVELLAASLGLLIAGFVAYDAYSQNPDHSGNSLLNAVMGALPFVLIAVIELTKIPLASGLYRVRHYGWKLFIFIALFALMMVTFETMFTGLERQMTNITARITDRKTEIQQIESSIRETERQIKQISDRSIESETNDINSRIAQTKEDGEQKLINLATIHSIAVNAIDQQIASLTNEQSKLQNSATSTFDSDIKSANERIDRLEGQIDQVSSEEPSDPRVTALETKNNEIRRLMSETEDWFKSNDEDRIKNAQLRIDALQDGIFGSETRNNYQKWRQQQDAEIASNNSEIRTLQTALRDQRKQLSEDELRIREELDGEINNRQSIQLQRAATIGTLLSNPPTPELVLIGASLAQARADLDAERKKYSQSSEDIRGETQAAQTLLVEQRSKIEANINDEKQSVSGLQDSITKHRTEIVNIQNVIRQVARNNQVYRFAQKWGTVNEDTGQREAYEDIEQVTEKDLTFVGAIWFGSIAVICATIGTVLALIANIMIDPDAFVEKQKSRKVQPVQRGLRLLFLLARKKLLKRRDVIERERIVEVEKLIEVEKEVEKIVEKIVEVEKIIEKVIEKEVERFVPEIIPIPIFLPNDTDHEVEMNRANNYYEAINNKVNEAIKKHSGN